MDPLGCTETSATNYQYTLHNITGGRKSHLHRGASLKSPVLNICNVAVLGVPFGIPWHTKSSVVLTLFVYVCDGGVGIQLFLLVHGMWIVGNKGCG